jgi:hypothetical protein
MRNAKHETAETMPQDRNLVVVNLVVKINHKSVTMDPVPPIIRAMLNSAAADLVAQHSSAERQHSAAASTIEQIITPHLGNPLIAGLKCEYCDISQEDAGKALQQCARCHKVVPVATKFVTALASVKRRIGRSRTSIFVPG